VYLSKNTRNNFKTPIKTSKTKNRYKQIQRHTNAKLLVAEFFNPIPKHIKSRVK